MCQLTSLLIVRANMEASEEDKLPEEEVLGQMKYVVLKPEYYFYLLGTKYVPIQSSHSCWNGHDL